MAVHSELCPIATDQEDLVADGKERLFDIQKDPQEYIDVSADPDYSETLSTARQMLIKRTLRIEQPLKREWAY